MYPGPTPPNWAEVIVESSPHILGMPTGVGPKDEVVI